MENEKLESLLIDYIDGKLNEAEKHDVEQELMRNSEAFKKYEQLKEVIHAMAKSSSAQPSLNLKRSFEEALKNEIASAKQAKVISMRPTFYRVAAAVALLIIGGGAGFWISKYQRQQQEIADIKKQLDETKLMMMSKLDNQYSASQRIQGVNVALTITKADDDVVKALVKAMNEDSNTNVRLAALDALSQFHQEPQVRKELVESLARQTDPVVQIALIQLMVIMKEKSILKDLERIIDKPETIKAVKDEAYSGIMKLS